MKRADDTTWRTLPKAIADAGKTPTIVARLKCNRLTRLTTGSFIMLNASIEMFVYFFRKDARCVVAVLFVGSVTGDC